MSYNRGFEVIENQVADYLKSATERVNNSENIDTLIELSKLFKKNVPLRFRKYVVAFMLKEALKHFHSFSCGPRERGGRLERDRNERSTRGRFSREDRDFYSEKKSEIIQKDEQTENFNSEERSRRPRVIIPESEATSVFISIGKNRHVYPRDLVGVLIAIAGIERDRIGDIKVLANYSFVQLYAADAQIVIDKLNGYDYRGKKLAVSYSRQCAEGESDENFDESEISKADFDSNAVSAQEMNAEDAAAYAAAEKAAVNKEPFGAN